MKEKIKAMEEKQRRDEKTSIQAHEYMIKIEESNRELKAKIKQLTQV